MTLQVYTSTLSYLGEDRLDVTRKGAAEGLFLAPSWAILLPVLKARRFARPGAGDAAAWSLYLPAYLDEMRDSYRRTPEAWRELLARETVTLCCVCNLFEWPGHCHRIVLAEQILPRLGAIYEGERPL